MESIFMTISALMHACGLLHMDVTFLSAYFKCSEPWGPFFEHVTHMRGPKVT